MTKAELAKALFGNNYEYIEHYGIKGQQWGKRRFQNEDGSLTAAGRLRYLNNRSRFDEDGNYIGEGKMSNDEFRAFAERDAERTSSIRVKENSKVRPGDFLNEEYFSNYVAESGIDTSRYSKSEIKNMQQIMYNESLKAANKTNTHAKTDTEFKQGEKNAENYYKNIEKERQATISQTIAKNDRVQNPANMSDKAKKMLDGSNDDNSRTDTGTGDPSFANGKKKVDELLSKFRSRQRNVTGNAKPITKREMNVKGEDSAKLKSNLQKVIGNYLDTYGRNTTGTTEGILSRDPETVKKEALSIVGRFGNENSLYKDVPAKEVQQILYEVIRDESEKRGKLRKTAKN